MRYAQNFGVVGELPPVRRVRPLRLRTVVNEAPPAARETRRMASCETVPSRHAYYLVARHEMTEAPLVTAFTAWLRARVA